MLNYKLFLMITMNKLWKIKKLLMKWRMKKERYNTCFKKEKIPSLHKKKTFSTLKRIYKKWKTGWGKKEDQTSDMLNNNKLFKRN